MRHTVVNKIKVAEFALGQKIPSDLFEFIANLKSTEKTLGSETWLFWTLKDKKGDTKDNFIITSSIDFKKYWGINGFVFAANGIGDYLVLLPDKEKGTLMETIFVMLHESAELKIFASNIDSLQLWGPKNYFWSNEFYLKMEDDILVKGKEAAENYEFEQEEEIFGVGFNKRSKIDEWIDEQKTEKASEIMIGLKELSVGEELNHKIWALNKLSDIYLKGFGMINSDMKKAIEYNHEAMELGSHEAYSNRAAAYYAGIGVKRDLKKALELAQKANNLSKISLSDLYTKKKKGLYNGFIKIIKQDIDHLKK